MGILDKMYLKRFDIEPSLCEKFKGAKTNSAPSHQIP